jgi:hypothetical protein
LPGRIAAKNYDPAVRWLQLEDKSRDLAADNSRDFRSFAVEALVGHRVNSWPFARFDISSGELRVRLSFPWFTTRSQQAAATRSVVVPRRFGDRWWLRFDDDGGSLGNVHVYPIYRRQEVVDELHRCGYHVAFDTAQSASRRHGRQS